MRVALLVGQFPVLSETFILNQITGLIDRGNTVEIFALENSESTTDQVHPDVEKYDLLKCAYPIARIPENYLWRVLKGIALLVTNFYKNPGVCLRSLNIFKYGLQAASLRLLYTSIPFLDKEPYDIIHSQFGMYGLQGVLLREIGAIQGKLISSFRGYDISWYVRYEGENVYDQLFEKGDFFLANCEYFRNRVIKLGCNPDKIAVHYSGIDCSRFVFTPRYLPPDNYIRIATTGRLVEKKGIEYGIRAIAKLRETHPQIEYNIIGDGVLREEFEQLINQLNLNDHVKLLGWKTQQEIIEILDRSQILIAPSVTAADGNQDAPVNTLKEAMAMGLPVIGTHHGGIPELIEEGISGFLVPERDAEAIAAKLAYLIEHPAVWPQMGKAGRAYVEEHFDINKLNDELVAVYRSLVQTKKLQLPPINQPVEMHN